MNRFTRFSVCRSSSLLRKNPFTKWSSSKPISSSSLISNNNNPSSSANLLRRVFISNPYPLPQIPGNHVRKFSGGAAAVPADCNISEDYLKKEIWDIDYEKSCAHYNVMTGVGPPLDAVKTLADRLDAFREKLGLDDNEEESGDESDDDYPIYLKELREKIENLDYYGDMVVAYGEYVAAGGSREWYPFMGQWRMLMKGGRGSRKIKNQKILASLQQMKLRSNLMKRLMKEYESRQNQKPQSTAILLEARRQANCITPQAPQHD